MTELNDDFPFLPGDVVKLLLNESEHGYSEIKIIKGDRTTILKSGETKMAVPAMVVTEVVREDSKAAHFFDENTGSKLKAPFKVCCTWFSHQTGQFQERWFNERVLRKVDDLKTPTSPVKMELDEIVILRTALFSNKQTSEAYKMAISSEGQTSKESIQVIRTFDSLAFLPPKMLVVSSKKRDPMPPIFEKNSGLEKRKISTWLVKCMWYDSKTGKFSEREFSTDELIPAEELGWENGLFADEEPQAPAPESYLDEV